MTDFYRLNYVWMKATKPETADEWDEIVSGLRKALAEAESGWREALHAERTIVALDIDYGPVNLLENPRR